MAHQNGADQNGAKQNAAQQQSRLETTRRDFLGLSAAALASLGAPAIWAGQNTSQKPSGGAPASSGIDLVSLTLAQAAQKIEKKQISPVELTRAALERIDALNPKVGAFITVAADQAMEAARAAEAEIQRGRYRGPLHGIPFGVKDTHYTKGIRTTAASPVLRDFVPDFDCTIVARLKEAGGILIGKLNLPEFSFGGYTQGAHNPWDLSRNPGGSSGGSAAAMAASMILASTGGDTSGSIRNPASTCGVVGHKPTYGLVSRYGVVPISWSLDHLGPIAKNVEDTAIILKIIAGHDPKDRFCANVAAADYPRLLRRNIRGLRVGYLDSEIAKFHPDTRQAFLEGVKVFEKLGARLEEVKFPDRMKVAGGAHGIIRITEAAAYHRQFLRSKAELYKSDVGVSGPEVSHVRTTVEAGSLITGAQYLKAHKARQLFLEDMARVFAPLDALLTPTMPAPADVDVEVPETFRNWWNLCGYPAVSVPCGFSQNPAGLPIGLQVATKPFEDALALALAYAYESATDWHTRHPAL